MARHVDPRGDYIAIATRKFAAHGYHGTSLAALAKDAGVSKQALLHFFGTKDRLYAEVLKALSERQCNEVDAQNLPDPVQHLTQHFTSVASSVLSNVDDARLVVHALLDSREDARLWPMKPYLDRLITLVRATPWGQTRSEEVALAWVFQMIGALQYRVIAAPAIAGMYGAQMSDTVAVTLNGFVQDAVANLAQAK